MLELDGDLVIDGIVGNADIGGHQGGAIQTLELLLVADLLFVVVGPDQVDVLRAGEDNEAHQTAKEYDEKAGYRDRPRISACAAGVVGIHAKTFR